MMKARMIRRSRPLTAVALCAALAAPSAGLAADEIDWGFRNNFRQYVYGGTGAPPITASAGATCDPNPDPMRGGCDPKIGTQFGVFGWTEASSSYALPSGAGTITGQGTVVFDRPDHLFTLSIIDPIITVESDGDAIVSTHVVLESTLPTVEPIDERMDLGEFTLTSLQATAATVTWNLGNGMITDEAAAALGSFLPTGSDLDPIRIILPVETPPAGGTPLASTRLLLKDDVANADKRGVKIIVTKQPSIVATDFDPMMHGAFVRVLGEGFANGYLLPAANWGALLKGGAVAGWKYSDKDGLNGPIFSALLKDGILKVLGKGATLGHSLATEPANLTVVFESGTGDYLCLAVGAGSKTAFKADKSYKAAKNPAPASCPAYVPY
jgi:hypothetical protein